MDDIMQHWLNELESIHGTVKVEAKSSTYPYESIVIASRSIYPFDGRQYVVWFYSDEQGFYSGKYDKTISEAYLIVGNWYSEAGIR